MRHRRSVPQGQGARAASSARCSPACSAPCATAGRTRRALPSTATETAGQREADPARPRRRSTSSGCCTLAKAAGTPCRIEIRDTHMVVTVPAAQEGAVRDGARAHARVSAWSAPAGAWRSSRRSAGRTRSRARFGLAHMTGTHAIGHTRMATESAVTTDGAHPFTTGPDQCLVHNGSLSNHNAVRRELMRAGPRRFQTENDTEVAAGYLTWQHARGRVAGRGAGGFARRARRLLHLRGRHRDRASACCAIRSPASRR